MPVASTWLPVYRVWALGRSAMGGDLEAAGKSFYCRRRRRHVEPQLRTAYLSVFFYNANEDRADSTPRVLFHESVSCQRHNN